MRIQIASRLDWTFVSSLLFSYGVNIPDGAFAGDGCHVWFLQNTPGGDPAPPPGRVSLLYLPTWQPVNHYIIGEMPARLAMSADKRYLYILQQYCRSILILRTDTE